jgi:hypothetical protein
MADDRIPSSSNTESEAVEDTEEKDDDQDNSCTSSHRGRNSDDDRREEERTSGYFSRVFKRRIGGDDLERRIELIDKREESVESRMIIRERTAERVNRSMIFLSVNLEVPHILPHLMFQVRFLVSILTKLLKFVVCGGNLCISEDSIEEFQLEREGYSDVAYVSSTCFSLFFLYPLLSLHKHS